MESNYDVDKNENEPKQSTLRYTNDTIKSFKTVEVFKSHTRDINSIDFSRDGTLLITSGKDDMLCLVDLTKREIVRKLYNRTFGCENVTFTHSNNMILCSSNKDFRIMYWCLHNNEVKFSFLGHSDLIIDINMNPRNDLFLTTSRDKTSRIWDLATKKCLYIFQESNYACFDNTGSVIASVAANINIYDKTKNFINLYSVDDIANESFKTFKIEDAEIKHFKFSSNSLWLICSTNENTIIIVDSFEGNIKLKLNGDIGEGDILIKSDISPDSRYVISGTEYGNIIIWSVENGNIVTNLNCHPKTSSCVKFNPRYCLIASACENLVIWQPN